MAITDYRYTAPTGAAALAGQTQTTSPTSGTTSSKGTTDSTTESSGTRQATTNTTQQNMSPQDAAALHLLIQQLMGGGTQQMAEDRARKIQEEQALQQQRQGYTKEAAFADAQGAMAQQLRLLMEKNGGALVRASEGAGTSQNSMRALLMQEAINQAAESSSALGLKAAVDYGGVSNNISQILMQHMAQQDPVMAALLQALNTSKGSVQNTQGTVNETTTGTQNTTGTTTNNGTTTTSGGTTTTQVGSGTTPALSNIGMMTSFGGNNAQTNLSAPSASYGSTNQQLLDLLDSAGGYSSNYTF